MGKKYLDEEGLRHLAGKVARKDHKHTASDVGALPVEGGTLTGTVYMKKVEGKGQGEWYKNHSATTDLGTVLSDKDEAGNVAQLIARAVEQKVYAKFSESNLEPKELFGEHNPDVAKEALGQYLYTYSDLAQLELTAGSETIPTIVRAMENDSMLQMLVADGYNMSQYPESGNGTLLVFKKNDSRTILIYVLSNLANLYFGVYYYANSTETWTGWKEMMTTDGGTISGILNLKKAENGYAQVHKNHNSDADYGVYIADFDADGDSFKLIISARTNTICIRNNADDVSHVLYGAHNINEMREDIGHRMKTYTDLTQIGLTAGSETIEAIGKGLPTYSRLTLTVGSGMNSSIYPNGNFGMLIVEKTVNSRVMFTFTNNQGTQWLGAFSYTSSGSSWTGWLSAASTQTVTTAQFNALPTKSASTLYMITDAEEDESGDGAVSPTIDVSEENGTTTLTITDVNGTKTVQIKSAYGYARDGGYTGTEAEFAAIMAQLANGGGSLPQDTTTETTENESGGTTYNITSNDYTVEENDASGTTYIIGG